MNENRHKARQAGRTSNASREDRSVVWVAKDLHTHTQRERAREGWMD